MKFKKLTRNIFTKIIDVLFKKFDIPSIFAVFYQKILKRDRNLALGSFKWRSFDHPI